MANYHRERLADLRVKIRAAVRAHQQIPADVAAHAAAEQAKADARNAEVKRIASLKLPGMP